MSADHSSDPQKAEMDSPRPRRRRGARRAAIAAIVTIVALAIAVPLLATSSADFFSRYHLLDRRFVNLEHSAHEGIGCRACHERSPLVNGIQLTADYYTSLFTKTPLPRYFTFQKPRNAACLNCHEGDWSSDAKRTQRIPHPAHQRVAGETRECVKCHKWTAHLETYMAKHKTMPFSGVCVAYGCHVGTQKSDQCFNCHHVLHESGAQWKTQHAVVAATAGQNACLESCHKVEQCQYCHTTGKKPQFTGRPIEIGMKAIEKLHVKPEWTARYHGAEALKDQTKCLLCHQSKGECDECHLQRPAFHGATDTWIGRHAKASKTINDPRCLTCHQKPWCETCHKRFKEME